MTKKTVKSQLDTQSKDDKHIEKLTQRAKQLNELLQDDNVREAGFTLDMMSVEVDRVFENIRLVTKVNQLKLNLVGDQEMRMRKLFGPVSDLCVTDALAIIDGMRKTVDLATQKYTETVKMSDLAIGWKDEIEETEEPKDAQEDQS